MSAASSNATAGPPPESIETIFCKSSRCLSHLTQFVKSTISSGEKKTIFEDLEKQGANNIAKRENFKATSPIHKSADPNLMNLFCSKVNSEPEEHEALRTLELLEVCVQSCGRRFHQEIGKFRFLNEMIKLVSPKYLANHTAEKVKKKVIELLYSWTQSLPSEVKISEAYQMLKRQSIIVDDPVYVTKASTTPVPQRTKSIFDTDEEKSKTLQRLLKSRRPEDLEQANALIKSFVKKDEEKIEKLSTRAGELEKVQNNVRVLSEMLIHYNQSAGTEAERETMTYLHDELEKLRPVLFRLATESEDGDEGLGEILTASDSLSRVLAQYDRLVRQSVNAKDDNVLPLLDDAPTAQANPAPRTLIDLTGGATGSSKSDESKSAASELDELFGSIAIASNSKPTVASSNANELDDCPPLFSPAITKPANQTSTSTNEGTTSKRGGLFDDLQDLLFDQSTGQKISSTRSTFQSPSSTTHKIPLNEMKNTSAAKPAESELPFPTVALESIRPSSENPPIPLKLSRNTGLQCVLHIARDTPRRDLIVSVLTVTNTNTSNPINNFHFEVTVPKTMRVNLQAPSGSDLPVYNPILPPQALTQILVVSNPQKEFVRLSYKLSYYSSGEQIQESSDIDNGFPSSVDLI